MITQFLTVKQQTASPSTIQCYRYQLDMLNDWLNTHNLGFKELDRDLFFKYLSDHPTWKGNTQYITLCATRSFVRWAYGAEHPMLTVNIRRSTPPQRMLMPEKLQTLINYLTPSTRPIDIRNLAIIMLLSDSGIRAAEACSLLVKYIDISSQLCTVYGKGRIWEQAAFGSTTAQQINRWLAIRERTFTNLPNKPSTIPDTLFFGISGSTPGTPLTPSGLRTVIKRIGSRAGIGQLSPHDLRRTFCTLSLFRGANTRQVQILGRWSDIRMVELYSRSMEIQMASTRFPFPVDFLNSP